MFALQPLSIRRALKIETGGADAQGTPLCSCGLHNRTEFSPSMKKKWAAWLGTKWDIAKKGKQFWFFCYDCRGRGGSYAKARRSLKTFLWKMQWTYSGRPVDVQWTYSGH